MSSIARRQQRLLLAGGAVACTVTAVVLITLVRSALIDDFDRALLDRARILATLVDYNEEGEVEFDRESASAGAFGAEEDAAYFRVWLLPDAPGSAPAELSRSGTLSRYAFEPEPAIHPPSGPGELAHGALSLPDGRRGRWVAIAFRVDRADEELPLEDQRRLVAQHRVVGIGVAADSRRVTALLARISIVIIGSAGVLLGALAVLSFVTVRRGLRPLLDASERVGAIDALALQSRLDERGAPDEVRPLLHAINELLQRIESSFERERLSRAMLAHELRTPVAELLATAEVATRFRDDPELARRSLARLLEGTRDLHRFVDALLHVARVQSGQVEPRLERVDVAALVRDVAATHSPMAHARSLDLSVETGDAACARTDPALLRVVASNLIGNAIDHSPRSGAVRIDVSGHDGKTSFHCANTVADPGALDLAALARPFRSGGSSATDRDRAEMSGGAPPAGTGAPPATTHLGLGLAATKLLCDSLGAAFSLALDDDRLIARVDLPAAP